MPHVQVAKLYTLLSLKKHKNNACVSCSVYRKEQKVATHAVTEQFLKKEESAWPATVQQTSAGSSLSVVFIFVL